MNYVTYENPGRKGDDCLICLPDRFSWFAFLLPPVWALANGLWLLLAVMIVSVMAFAQLSGFFALPGFSLYFLFALWLGFEANGLVGAKLIRGGWQDNSLVPASGLMQAETKYFSSQRRMHRMAQKRKQKETQENSEE